MRGKISFSRIIAFLFCIGCGGAMIFIGTTGFKTRYLTKPVTFDQVNYNNPEGTYVKDTVQLVYGVFCEGYQIDFTSKVFSGKDITDQSYLISGSGPGYMAIIMEGSDIWKADRLMDRTWDYLSGEITWERLAKSQFEIEGKLQKLTGQQKNYFEQYADEFIEASGGDESDRKLFHPYYIEIGGEADGLPVFLCIILWASGAGFIFWGFSGISFWGIWK